MDANGEEGDETDVNFTYRNKTKRSNGEPSDKVSVRTMKLPALLFLSRFLQHVLPKRHQRARHHSVLSRASSVNLDDLPVTMLKRLAEIEPNLKLVDWTVPVLATSIEDGPKCRHAASC